MAITAQAKVKAERRDKALVRLLGHDGAGTRGQMAETSTIVRTMEAEGYIKRIGHCAGGRGRPAVVYRLTDKGRKRARKAAAK